MATVTTSRSLSSSTNEIAATLRRALLYYQDPEKIIDARSIIDERLYQVRAPDTPTFPYAAMRLLSRNNGELSGIKLFCQLEVLLFGRPWAQQEDLNDCADLFEQAMLFYVQNNQGLLFCTGKDRATLPVAGSPIDAETIAIRLMFNLTIYPQYLYKIATTVPATPQ